MVNKIWIEGQDGTSSFSSNQTTHQAQAEQLWTAGALPQDRPAPVAEVAESGTAERDLVTWEQWPFPIWIFCGLGQLNHSRAKETITLLRNKIV